MLILNQEKKNLKLNNIFKKMKKSQLCIFGSLLVIIGITLLSMEHIKELKKQVFSDMQLSFMNKDNVNDIIQDIPEVEELEKQNSDDQINKIIDYSKYTGIIEIPKIRLKRGFYNVGHKYNDIEHNVTVIGGSNMPDVVNGNLILAAHSGDAYISYFAYLYKLIINDYIYITYNGITYKYQLVNIYNVPKTGSVTINRNEAKTTLTLITCTKNSDTEQTVYIAELV